MQRVPLRISSQSCLAFHQHHVRHAVQRRQERCCKRGVPRIPHRSHKHVHGPAVVSIRIAPKVLVFNRASDRVNILQEEPPKVPSSVDVYTRSVGCCIVKAAYAYISAISWTYGATVLGSGLGAERDAQCLRLRCLKLQHDTMHHLKRNVFLAHDPTEI